MPEQEIENLQAGQVGSDDSPSGKHGDQSNGQSSESVEVEGLSLNEIPEHVRPMVIERLKALRADHTRKTQEASERMREVDSIRQKAALADLMLQNPQINNLVNGKTSPNGPNGDHDDDAEDEKSIEQLTPEAKGAVEAMLRRFQKRNLAPIFDPVIERFQRFEQKEIAKEWGAVTKEFPEVESRKDKVMAFLTRNPTTADLREAVLASIGPEIIEARLKASQKADLTSRKDAQIQRNGTPGSQTQSVEKPKFKTLGEALKAHLAKNGKS